MESIIGIIEVALEYLVEIAAIALEVIGIYVMLDASVKGFKRWLNHEPDGPQLEEGILEALEFMMCGEVLKTVTANDMSDYIALASIIVIRFALAAEVQWELKKKAWHADRREAKNDAKKTEERETSHD